MNRKSKSILIILLVVLMLVVITGVAVAERPKNGVQELQYSCWHWQAREAVTVGPITYIGNGMCSWTLNL